MTHHDNINPIIVVDEEKKTVRLVLIRGERIGCQELQAWDCEGPYEVTFHHNRTGW